MNRRVSIVLLCEDSQQEAFVRRFLKGTGWETREIRVEKSPGAKGSAEQWVRENFPKELVEYRRRKARAASALIAVIDADTRSVQQRHNEFKEACSEKNMPFRNDDDSIAIIVPKRNIETWVYYLEGNAVDEDTLYPKLQRERNCRLSVERLLKLCRTTGLIMDAPSSLTAACDEYNRRIKILMK